jgi:hypothetical protein
MRQACATEQHAKREVEKRMQKAAVPDILAD